MTAKGFAKWVDSMRQERGWTDTECSRQLGCGINQVRRWRSYDPPRYIELACTTLSNGIMILPMNDKDA